MEKYILSNDKIREVYNNLTKDNLVARAMGVDPIAFAHAIIELYSTMQQSQPNDSE